MRDLSTSRSNYVLTMVVIGLLFSLGGVTSSAQDSSDQDDQASYSTSRPRVKSETAPVRSPAEVLRTARTVYVRSFSVYFSPEALENSLLKRAEFWQWGMVITRDEGKADIVVEVHRKVFTKFVMTIIDPQTNNVLASGKVSSLGGTLEEKLAKKFVNRVRQVRP